MTGKNTKVAEGHNFTAISVGKYDALMDNNKGKVFIKEDVKSTGAEVSFGLVPAGVASPIFHAHKQNEELYIVIKGKGEMTIDNESFPLAEGTVVRVAPKGSRTLKAAADSDLIYIVAQVKENSLQQWSMEDGIIN